MSDAEHLPPLGSGPEFDRIRALWRRMGNRVADVGDDAAIVHVGAEQLAFTSDLSLEGQHFRRTWLTAYEIGWRAAAGALSDLAAVAADPVGVLTSIGVPASDAGGFLEELADGIADATAAVGAVIWGGDLAKGEHVAIDVMCVGRVTRPVRRSGASVGDALYVTGRLGGPCAAVAAWERGEPPVAAHRERFAHPVPRIREAQWLRDRGATAMIDISDGLAGDADHIAAASCMCCAIDVGRVPLVGGVSWGLGVASGEEYELLVTIPNSVIDEKGMRDFGEEFDLALTRIGQMEFGRGVRFEREGKTIETPGGFSHF